MRYLGDNTTVAKSCYTLSLSTLLRISEVLAACGQIPCTPRLINDVIHNTDTLSVVMYSFFSDEQPLVEAKR